MKLGDYKDSAARCENLLVKLSKYNGTYEGESTEFNGVTVYLYIKDGEVKAQFAGQVLRQSEFEMYLYGQLKTGEELLAFALEIGDSYLYSPDREYSEGFAIQQLSDGSYLVTATEGNEYYTWNGFYYKISDDTTVFD